MPDNPLNFTRGAPISVYLGGRYLGQTHGGLELSQDVEMAEVESDQTLAPLRLVKTGESFKLSVALGEVSLENLKDIWGVPTEIVGGVLKFGGSATVIEKEVILTLPKGTNKKWVITLYRGVIMSPGPITWSKTEQTDLPLEITLLPDTTKPAGEQFGKVEEQAL